MHREFWLSEVEAHFLHGILVDACPDWLSALQSNTGFTKHKLTFRLLDKSRYQPACKAASEIMYFCCAVGGRFKTEGHDPHCYQHQKQEMEVLRAENASLRRALNEGVQSP